jgi:hypothetical protein
LSNLAEDGSQANRRGKGLGTKPQKGNKAQGGGGTAAREGGSEEEIFWKMAESFCA